MSRRHIEILAAKFIDCPATVSHMHRTPLLCALYVYMTTLDNRRAAINIAAN